jgi:hypothetical protein
MTIRDDLPKKLVQFIASRMYLESALLDPDRPARMADPYGLLDLIRAEVGLTSEIIDAWMVEAQPGNRP